MDKLYGLQELNDRIFRGILETEYWKDARARMILTSKPS